jgi:hypothetical protein
MADEPLDAILRRTALLLDRLAASHAQHADRLDLLTEAAAHHSERLDRMDMFIAEQREMNASLKEMLARMLRQEPNGRTD